jgi:hypothetical protein
MKNTRDLTRLLIIMVLTAFACDISSSPPPPNSQDIKITTENIIATSVAATLAASSREENVPTETSETELPSSVIMPTTPPLILRVAYTSRSDVWLWTETEGSVQLTTGINAKVVHVSDDGSMAAILTGSPNTPGESVWAVN